MSVQTGVKCGRGREVLKRENSYRKAAAKRQTPAFARQERRSMTARTYATPAEAGRRRRRRRRTTTTTAAAAAAAAAARRRAAARGEQSCQPLHLRIE